MAIMPIVTKFGRLMSTIEKLRERVGFAHGRRLRCGCQEVGQKKSGFFPDF
jgi:hypothetical protein